MTDAAARTAEPVPLTAPSRNDDTFLDVFLDDAFSAICTAGALCSREAVIDALVHGWPCHVGPDDESEVTERSVIRIGVEV